MVFVHCCKKNPLRVGRGREKIFLECVPDRLNFFAIVIAELMFDLFERLAHGFGDAQR